MKISNRVTLPGKARRALVLVDPALDVFGPVDDRDGDTEIVQVTFDMTLTGIEIGRAPVGFFVASGGVRTSHDQMFEATAHACKLARSWVADHREALTASQAAPDVELSLEGLSPKGTHITVPAGLLIACYHALQSYVYGNTAPALAKACADELAPHLPPSAGARQS